MYAAYTLQNELSSKLQRTKVESKSQRFEILLQLHLLLSSKLQRTKVVPNSGMDQKQIIPKQFGDHQNYKEQKLKANHNT